MWFPRWLSFWRRPKIVFTNGATLSLPEVGEKTLLIEVAGGGGSGGRGGTGLIPGYSVFIEMDRATDCESLHVSTEPKTRS